MKTQQFFKIIIALIIMLFFTQLSCVKEPYKPDYEQAGGYVIGREFCKANETENYWLVDLTVYPNTKHYGDTLILNGIQYTNVVKTKELIPEVKIIGYKVALDFKVSDTRVETTGCTMDSPITYKLREITIINVGLI